MFSVRIGHADYIAGGFLPRECEDDLQSIEDALACFKRFQGWYEELEVDEVAEFLERDEVSDGKMALSGCLSRYWGVRKNLDRGVNVFNRLLRQKIYQSMWDECMDVFDSSLCCQLFINGRFAVESRFDIRPSAVSFGHWGLLGGPIGHLREPEEMELCSRFEKLYEAADEALDASAARRDPSLTGQTQG